jgi:hypothetical protein
MCQYINVKNVPDGGFTANEDIVCYKTITKDADCNYRSLLYSQIWKRGGQRKLV